MKSYFFPQKVVCVGVYPCGSWSDSCRLPPSPPHYAGTDEEHEWNTLPCVFLLYACNVADIWQGIIINLPCMSPSAPSVLQPKPPQAAGVPWIMIQDAAPWLRSRGSRRASRESRALKTFPIFWQSSSERLSPKWGFYSSLPTGDAWTLFEI